MQHNYRYRFRYLNVKTTFIECPKFIMIHIFTHPVLCCIIQLFKKIK